MVINAMKTLIKNVTALIRKGDGKYVTRVTDIRIDGDTIVSVSKSNASFVPDKMIDGTNKLAIPGLINAHTHAYMTCFRGLADDLPFSEWLFERIMPNEDRLTDEDAYEASLAGCLEMLKSGTTCYLDMHMFKGMSAKASIDTGIRCVLSRGLVGSGDDEAGTTRLAQAFDEMETFSSCPALSFALAPHAIYTTDADFLKKVASLAKKHSLPVHIHLSESVNEVEECRAKTGMTPVEYLDSLGFFENRVIAAHCANLTDNDIRILAERKVNVVLCVRSNMKLGNGIPSIKKLHDAGVNLCLGTDSAGSNNTLNLFAEIAAVSLISKGVERSPVCITAPQVLDMATYNAAQALGLDSGVIAKGKKADIALLDLESPAFVPANDLVSSLCYSANGSEVDTVIVGGNTVVENGRLLSMDEKEIIKRVSKIIPRLKERMK